MYTPQMVSDALHEITDHLAPLVGASSAAQLDTEIGTRIARLVGRDDPYSRSLVHLVRSGKKQPSDSFAEAVMAYAYTLDGVHPYRARSKQIEVLAVGNVQPGALILADSRCCAYPPCSVPFVPRTPNQHHCSRDCQVKNYNLKRRPK
jgi:hypothetical protein